jgi:hypothetical protein
MNGQDEDWFQELENQRQAREDADERLRVIADLQQVAARSDPVAIAAVLPDDDDPLETMDPTPDSDLDFPMSLEEWNLTWHIEYFEQYSFVDAHYVTDDEE